MMSLDELAKVREAIEHIRFEADFNRSWTDGRRSPGPWETPEYIARRRHVADQRDEWADLIERLVRAQGIPA